MLRLRQKFPRPRVENIPATIRETLGKLNLGNKIKRGQTVALTAGSRGIANIAVILKSVVQHRPRSRRQPFLVPAMGSHGGATAEGQIQVLHSYGITEDFVGAPIRSSMDVIHLGDTPEGWPVYLDKNASTADHIGVVARVKPHTSYNGPIESGLLKMMMIGLGKRHGAAHYHRLLLEQPYDPVVRSVSRVMRGKAPIAFGLGNCRERLRRDGPARSRPARRFRAGRRTLARQGEEWLGRLPFHEADLLIIDEIGKDISGSGMDTNVVGRKRALRSDTVVNQPNMRYIFLRGLSAHTHGNACGIGFADFCTNRLVKAMDYNATVINCVTSGYPEGANVSVHFDTDREVLDDALSIIGTRAIGKGPHHAHPQHAACWRRSKSPSRA